MRVGDPQLRKGQHTPRPRGAGFPGCLVLFLAGCLLAFPAWGSLSQASSEKFFQEGVKAYRAGDYFQAGRAFVESAQRRPASGTLQNLGTVEWLRGDLLALPFDRESFDAATVGFGARNFSDLDRGLSEMARVVRPGGRVVVLEITTPRRPPLSTFFELWFDRVVPELGRLVDTEAYSYLPKSVRRFPGPGELAADMWSAGLRDIRYVLTAGGIIALHVGVVPT